MLFPKNIQKIIPPNLVHYLKNTEIWVSFSAILFSLYVGQ